LSNKDQKEFLVPKERAVFWLDAYGRWHNDHGVFEHKKIIDYFHSSIRMDDKGYYLFQKLDNHTQEKVYFKYEDTALFVFGVKTQDDSDKIQLILNTKDKIPLIPENLFVQNDHLYINHKGHRIKFLDRAMLKLAHRLNFDKYGYHLSVSGRVYDIPIQNR
jgi:hypothetical protein